MNYQNARTPLTNAGSANLSSTSLEACLTQCRAIDKAINLTNRVNDYITSLSSLQEENKKLKQEIEFLSKIIAGTD